MRIAHHGLLLGILALIGSALGWVVGNKQNDARVAAGIPEVPNSEFRSDGESLREVTGEAKLSTFIPVPRIIGRFNTPYFHKDGRLDGKLATALNLTPNEVVEMEKILADLRAEIEEAQAAAAIYTYDENGRIYDIVVPAITETREYEHRFRKGIEQVVGEDQAAFSRRAMWSGNFISEQYWSPRFTALYRIRYNHRYGSLSIGRELISKKSSPERFARGLEKMRAISTASDSVFWGKPDAVLPPGIRHLFPESRSRRETGG